MESLNAGNPNGNKCDMKAIQGCWKRMKLQTKKEFDEQRRERRRQVVVKSLLHQLLLVKLVADVIPASGQQPCY